VNAVLRRVSRERDRLPLPPRPSDPSDRTATVAYLSTALSHPAWLVSRWLDRYGFESVESWARFNNSPAPLTLRANTLKIGRDELAARLRDEGIECENTTRAADGLIVRSGNPLSSSLHDLGFFVVQDEASQLVGSYAGARAGETVLDACASPGGKTLVMAAASRGEGLIVASDVRPRRVNLLSETVARSGAANIAIVQADVTGTLPFGRVFDRVLLDAPCSGLGTVRRDPDIKWRRQEADLPTFAAAQQKMLEAVAAVVKEGGAIVYSTCSSEPEENDGLIGGFTSRHPEFRVEGDPLRTLPSRDGLEAFFAAMLVRTKHLR
jgi:16S rRNA (cytosine967-C5)-methyltransferase